MGLLTSALLSLIAASWLLGILRYGRVLLDSWKEPTLLWPVLIVESDDWGPGPLAQAEVLLRLSSLLTRFQDQTGRSAVMTLALQLAAPDRASIRESSCHQYGRVSLSHDDFEPILAAIREGEERGVFAAQLHCLEHFWPAALLAAADTTNAVRAWLLSSEDELTEALPPHLQSRWVDASRLPTRALPAHEISRAATEEVEQFASIIGRRPRVAVPPTFVWNEEVEKSWHRSGVRFVVTPGARYVGRDSDGTLLSDATGIYNGLEAKSGVRYLVRDAYFEPALGHTAEATLESLDRKTRDRRPTLLETHRSNFLGDEQQTERCFRELARLFERALERFPHLRFLTTEELGESIFERDPKLVATGLLPRLSAWLTRAARVRNLRLLFWTTAAGLAFSLLAAWAEMRGMPSP